MNAKAFSFFEQCSELDPDKYKQDDETACVERVTKMYASDDHEIVASRVQEVLRFFQMKLEARDVPLPELPQLPEEIRSGPKTDANLMIVKEHYIQVRDILRQHMMGSLDASDLIDKRECIDLSCNGFCPVQAVKFLDMFVDRESPPLFVPCITEESKNLELFEVVDFHVVSNLTFFTWIWCPNLSIEQVTRSNCICLV